MFLMLVLMLSIRLLLLLLQLTIFLLHRSYFRFYSAKRIWIMIPHLATILIMKRQCDNCDYQHDHNNHNY